MKYYLVGFLLSQKDLLHYFIIVHNQYVFQVIESPFQYYPVQWNSSSFQIQTFFMCAFNMPFYEASSNYTNLAICALVSPCQDSVLVSVSVQLLPFFQRDFCNNGKDFEYIFSLLAFLLSIVACMFPLLSLLYMHYVSYVTRYIHVSFFYFYKSVMIFGEGLLSIGLIHLDPFQKIHVFE